jgi:MoaE-MoaD fusion protein
MMASDSATLNVLLFAALKDRAGTDRLTVVCPLPATIATIRAAIADQYPAVAELLPTSIAARNHEFAFPADPVVPGDEIAFFPPVSGGSEDNASQWIEICRIDADPIDLNELTAAISSPATGAVCLFSGVVRGETSRKEAGHPDTRQTNLLEYETYAPMAIAKMKQVIAEIRAQWPLVQGIAVVQRIGALTVGQPTVLIACASGHRDQGCFEAAHYGIDRLKEIVPVWKKEVSPTGEQWIEGGYLPTPADRTPPQAG